MAVVMTVAAVTAVAAVVTLAVVVEVAEVSTATVVVVTGDSVVGPNETGPVSAHESEGVAPSWSDTSVEVEQASGWEGVGLSGEAEQVSGGTEQVSGGVEPPELPSQASDSMFAVHISGDGFILTGSSLHHNHHYHSLTISHFFHLHTDLIKICVMIGIRSLFFI